MNDNKSFLGTGRCKRLLINISYSSTAQTDQLAFYNVVNVFIRTLPFPGTDSEEAGTDCGCCMQCESCLPLQPLVGNRCLSLPFIWGKRIMILLKEY